MGYLAEYLRKQAELDPVVEKARQRAVTAFAEQAQPKSSETGLWAGLTQGKPWQAIQNNTTWSDWRPRMGIFGVPVPWVSAGKALAEVKGNVARQLAPTIEKRLTDHYTNQGLINGATEVNDMQGAIDRFRRVGPGGGQREFDMKGFEQAYGPMTEEQRQVLLHPKVQGIRNTAINGGINGVGDWLNRNQGVVTAGIGAGLLGLGGIGMMSGMFGGGQGGGKRPIIKVNVNAGQGQQGPDMAWAQNDRWRQQQAAQQPWYMNAANQYLNQNNRTA